MAYREFQDDGGRAWTVWDTYPESAHRGSMGALQGGWLTFESGGERRRLIPAPVGWNEETEDRLRDWLGFAQTAKPRLEEYEARTAAAAIPVIRDDSRVGSGRFGARRPVEDMRSLLERSRQTLDDLDRAIDGRYAPAGDPPREADARES